MRDCIVEFKMALSELGRCLAGSLWRRSRNSVDSHAPVASSWQSVASRVRHSASSASHAKLGDRRRNIDNLTSNSTTPAQLLRPWAGQVRLPLSMSLTLMSKTLHCLRVHSCRFQCQTRQNPTSPQTRIPPPQTRPTSLTGMRVRQKKRQSSRHPRPNVCVSSILPL